jgi:hypothetical protein
MVVFAIRGRKMAGGVKRSPSSPGIADIARDRESKTAHLKTGRANSETRASPGRDGKGCRKRTPTCEAGAPFTDFEEII